MLVTNYGIILNLLGYTKDDEREVFILTVHSDLEKIIAYCEAIKGNYAIMAHSTDDRDVKDMLNSMKADIEKHIEFLSGRLEYLNENNDLNTQ